MILALNSCCLSKYLNYLKPCIYLKYGWSEGLRSKQDSCITCLDFHSEPDSFTISSAENELHVNKNSDNIPFSTDKPKVCLAASKWLKKTKKPKNIIKMQTRKFEQKLDDIRIKRITFCPNLGHNFFFGGFIY